MCFISSAKLYILNFHRENASDLNRKFSLLNFTKFLGDNFLTIRLSDFIFDDSLNLENFSNITKDYDYSLAELYLIDVKITRAIRFDIGKAPLVVGQNEQLRSVQLRLSFTKLDEIYSGLTRVNIASSDDILMNYFGFENRIEEFSNSNKSDLISRFCGLFGFYLAFFQIDSSNSFGNKKISVLLFQNALIDELYLSGYTNTSIRKYFLELEDIKQEEDDLNLNIYINRLSICNIYNLLLNRDILKHSLLLQMRSMKINGNLRGIESELFKLLKSMRDLTLNLENFREFWHSSSEHAWILSLNKGLNVDLDDESTINSNTTFELLKKSRFIFKLHDVYNRYNFPDEDICFFMHLSYKRLIFTILAEEFKNESVKYLVDTCLKFYLTKHSNLIEKIWVQTFILSISPEINDSTCNFERLFNSCKTSDLKKVTEISTYDISYILEWIELVGPILTFPIISIIGIITNLLVVITVTSKKNKEYLKENKRTFEYMASNSVFNVVECFLSVFTLMSECLGNGSVFCSSVMHQDSVKAFKVYVVTYFGEVMKTCSLLTIIGFSLERYILASDTNIAWLKKFSNIKKRYIFVFIFLFSCLTCVNKIFEYKISTDQYGLNDDYLASNEAPKLNIFYLVNDSYQNLKLLFMISYYLHYILNDFILLSANFLVDLALVKQVRRDLRAKKKFLKELRMKFKIKTKTKSTGLSELKNKLILHEKLEQIAEAEENTNKMILYSLILFAFCRLPELILYMYLLNTSDLNADTTYGSLLVNIIQYFYNFSYLTNLIFYLKFNKNFRDSFRNLFNLKNKSNNIFD